MLLLRKKRSGIQPRLQNIFLKIALAPHDTPTYFKEHLRKTAPDTFRGVTELLPKDFVFQCMYMNFSNFRLWEYISPSMLNASSLYMTERKKLVGKETIFNNYQN